MEAKTAEIMCGGCGVLIPSIDSLCEKCREELLSGKTAWVNETKNEKKLVSTF